MEKKLLVKKLFVISSIGGEGSAIRLHADKVLENIIEAGRILEREGLHKPSDVRIEILRGERDLSLVPSGILDKILTYDLLIVVLFETNGNVFYESGVAHSAGRPLLFIKQPPRCLTWAVTTSPCLTSLRYLPRHVSLFG